LTAKGANFYDTWCECGTVCHREISAYIEETKRNAAYGNQDGAIGANLDPEGCVALGVVSSMGGRA